MKKTKAKLEEQEIILRLDNKISEQYLEQTKVGMHHLEQED